jgi:hypothetical protein
MIYPFCYLEVATPSIGTKKSLRRGVMVMVHRRLPHPVRLRQSKGLCVDMSIFLRAFGTLCLLVRFGLLCDNLLSALLRKH